jgi:hypothetical protein
MAAQMTAPPAWTISPGHKADAQDVGVAVLLAEAEALGEVRADHVAIEDGDLASAFEQERGQHLGGGALAGAAQAGEPDAEALLVARGIHLAQDLGGFGAGEPLGQEFALGEVLITHLGAGDVGVFAPAGTSFCST